MLWASFIIWLTLFSLIYSFKTNILLNFLDLSKLKYDVIESSNSSVVSFQFENRVKPNKIYCKNCIEIEQDKVKCENDKIIYLYVEYYYQSRYFQPVFIMPCRAVKSRQNQTLITDLKAIEKGDHITVTWNTSTKEIFGYIIDYMDGEDQLTKLYISSYNQIILTGLSVRTRYQICLSSIDSQMNMGNYKCIKIKTGLLKSGLVKNIRVKTFYDKIQLLWDKPYHELGDPDIYVVNIYNELTCRTIIIDLGSNLIPEKGKCDNLEIKKWNSLQKLEIIDLSPQTTYNVEIVPYKNYIASEFKILQYKTKEIGSIKESTFETKIPSTQQNHSKPQSKLDVNQSDVYNIHLHHFKHDDKEAKDSLEKLEKMFKSFEFMLFKIQLNKDPFIELERINKQNNSPKRFDFNSDYNSEELPSSIIEGPITLYKPEDGPNISENLRSEKISDLVPVFKPPKGYSYENLLKSLEYSESFDNVKLDFINESKFNFRPNLFRIFLRRG